MSVFHLGQAALACGALCVVTLYCRRVLIDARCDSTAFMLAAAELRSRALDSELLALARACEPAWLARLSAMTLSPIEGHDPEELIERLRSELSSTVRALAALARLAMALGFLTVLLELAGALSGDHGLLALQRGLVERLALEAAALAFAIAIATASLCYAAARLIRARGIELIGELRSALRTFKSARS